MRLMWYSSIMNDFRKLRVWTLSMEMTRQTYEATRGYPVAERYGLQSQMHRASVSVPSSIAEGCSRSTNSNSRLFLTIARGSAFELESQAILSEQIGLLKSSVGEHLLQTIWRCQAMLSKLIQPLDPLVGQRACLTLCDVRLMIYFSCQSGFSTVHSGSLPQASS
jgi:four helix bundle protein